MLINTACLSIGTIDVKYRYNPYNAQQNRSVKLLDPSSCQTVFQK